MKKRFVKWVIIMVLILVAAAAVLLIAAVRNRRQAVQVSTTTLTPMTLTNSISTKGIVESVSKRTVSTTLGYMVQEIFVEVGDRVTAGQVLCQLDTEDLTLNIAQQRADLDVSQQNSLLQLENNRRLYEEALANKESGSNTQILNAEANVRTAKINLDNAQRNYDDAVRDRDEGKTPGVVNAESALASAKLDLDNKTRDLENNRALYAEGVVTRETVTQSETAVTNAQHKYNDAQESLASAQLSEQRAIEQSANSLKTARTNYENALSARSAALTAADQDLERYKNNIATAEVTANMDAKLIALQKLEKQLADSTITAPVAGTVTAVYAREGQTAGGLLFVIEDTDHLQVKTHIKEYDAGRVKAGMTVLIRSDATGSEVYNGTVTKLNPTAEKNAQGDTNTAGDIEFGAEVSVDSTGTPLKIGMNTRLTVILEEKDAVYCVPYDALATVDGQDVIYVLARGDRNRNTAQAIPVTTGMETDFYIEIESPSLTDGMRVISDAVNITDGMAVRLPSGTAADDQALLDEMAGY